MTDHKRIDGAAGDGYTAPREAGVTCSCGALIWTWQQFYEETSEDPDAAWAEHLDEVGHRAR